MAGFAPGLNPYIRELTDESAAMGEPLLPTKRSVRTPPQAFDNFMQHGRTTRPPPTRTPYTPHLSAGRMPSRAVDFGLAQPGGHGGNPAGSSWSTAQIALKRRLAKKHGLDEAFKSDVAHAGLPGATAGSYSKMDEYMMSQPIEMRMHAVERMRQIGQLTNQEAKYNRRADKMASRLQVNEIELGDILGSIMSMEDSDVKDNGGATASPGEPNKASGTSD